MMGRTYIGFDEMELDLMLFLLKKHKEGLNQFADEHGLDCMNHGINEITNFEIKLKILKDDE